MNVSRMVIVVLGIVSASGALAQTQVPHTFSPGQPARASEVNENFSALEAAVNQNADDIAAIGSPAGSGFNLSLVDVLTGTQVGVGGASGSAWKMITPQGDELVQFGWPSPLPEINTDVSVVDFWLYRVRAWYSCDNGTLLGWGSDWLSESGASNLPAELDNGFVTREFGSLPNGDVVLADIAQSHSIVWSGNYGGTPLDPAWDGIGIAPVTVDCAIYVGVTLGPPAELKWSPFNMSWSTALQDIVHNAHFSADLLGPYSVTPYVWFTNDLVNDDPNLGNPLFDALIDQCSALAAQPCEKGQNTSDPTFDIFNEPNIVLKKASYTQTLGVSSISTVAELPGNRAEARSFKLVWK